MIPLSGILTSISPPRVPLDGDCESVLSTSPEEGHRPRQVQLFHPVQRQHHRHRQRQHRVNAVGESVRICRVLECVLLACFSQPTGSFTLWAGGTPVMWSSLTHLNMTQ